MRRVLPLILGLCLVVCWAGLPSVAVAAGEVNVKVQVVHATKAHSKVDPRLGKVAKHYKRLGYTGFKLLSSEQLSLSLKGKKSVAIAGGRRMIVSVLSKDAKRARLRVQIQGKRGKIVDTTVSVKRNGMMIVAGPRYKKGILVLPIWVRY
jgi:hypothetical protein